MSNATEATALVVVYKKSFADCETIQSLLNLDQSRRKLNLVIWDNSPVAFDNIATLIELNRIFQSVKEIHTPENISLSKIYNDVSENFSGDYLTIFDQDSDFEPDYFTVNAACPSTYSLLLPIVRSEGRIVSPGHYDVFKGRHWAAERRGPISSKNTVAITSGLSVSKAYLSLYPRPFDERFKLYGVDTAFMLDYSSKERNCFVSDNTIKHNSALWSALSASEMLPRFRSFRSASIALHSRRKTYPLALLYNLYSSVKMAIRYKDIRFIR